MYENSNKIFIDIKWYEWLYSIYRDGRVWSYPREWIKWSGSCKNGRFLKKWMSSSWYFSVALCKNWIPISHLIHRLLLEHFVENPENKEEVNHINWIRTDNRVENLEWCTSKENSQHSYHVLKRKPSHLWRFWGLHHRSKKVLQVDKLWNNVKTFWSTYEAQRETGYSQSGVSACARGKTSHFHWFIWKYI